MDRTVPINLVWIKRDLRTSDHAPLDAAEKAGLPYRILFMWEPDLLGAPDQSDRHRCFEWQSLQDMNRVLAPYHRCVELIYANAVEVMDWFCEHHSVCQVFSYQESGTGITYRRDLAVKKLLLNHGVAWQEFQCNGVVRGLKNREGWDRRWYGHVSSPCIHNTYSCSEYQTNHHRDGNPLDGHSFPCLPPCWDIPFDLLKRFTQYHPTMQAGGQMNGWLYWSSFVRDRHRNYHLHISKPTESRKSCSRLSPYLAWGNLSIRQLWQACQSIQELPGSPPPNFRALQAFQSRLRWHDHFVQKFEQNYHYEDTAVNRAFDELPAENDPAKIQAWQSGSTGYPMVDASMRALLSTGWINFRMRAMLVSFLTHTLNVDWRYGVHHLAGLFLDYHPGIHYTQFQMQAGVTGTNLIRTYNPSLNGIRHDAAGTFVRTWIPEIGMLPDHLIHQPWTISSLEAGLLQYIPGITYPHPIVDPTLKTKPMVTHLWNTRRSPNARLEKARILSTFSRPRKPKSP
jgi:deoxyribodipyrimidine photo-lyase